MRSWLDLFDFVPRGIGKFLRFNVILPPKKLPEWPNFGLKHFAWTIFAHFFLEYFKSASCQTRGKMPLFRCALGEIYF